MWQKEDLWGGWETQRVGDWDNGERKAVCDLCLKTLHPIDVGDSTLQKQRSKQLQYKLVL